MGSYIEVRAPLLRVDSYLELLCVDPYAEELWVLLLSAGLDEVLLCVDPYAEELSGTLACVDPYPEELCTALLCVDS
jgi:hypothetical protein